jgi:hypothetical protein
LSPILSRMGLFSLCSIPDFWLEVSLGVLSERTKVNRRGSTTLLWIKRVFGVCGELWLISGCSWFRLGLSLGIFGKLQDDEGGNWMGKTWTKRGELRGFCGQFAGCYRLMPRGSDFLVDEFLQIHSGNERFVSCHSSAVW